MALDYDGTNDYIETTDPVDIEPLSMACWYYSTGAGDAFEPLICLADSAHTGGDDKQIRLVISTDNGANWAVEANSWSTDGYDLGAATAASSYNTWQHACGVFASTSSRSGYLNGANKGTDTNANTATATPDELNIGYGPFSGGTGDKWNGYLAEIAVWDVALTDVEVAMLGTDAVSPLFVRPANLVLYVPGIRTAFDLIASRSLTVGGSLGVQPHPRIVYPSQQHIITNPPRRIFAIS